jgi:osmoprotectant transport system ATP-binding protein
VARALAAEPELMLMDEPFGALDPMTRGKLGESYRALHDRLGLTTLMVTHDPQEAILLADRILVVGGGGIVADGTPRAILAEGPAEAVELLDRPRHSAERVRALLAGEGRADG